MIKQFASRESSLPLETIHQTPGDIHLHLAPVLDGVQHGLQIRVEVVDSLDIVGATSVANSILGNVNRWVVVLAADPVEQLVHSRWYHLPRNGMEQIRFGHECDEDMIMMTLLLHYKQDSLKRVNLEANKQIAICL